SDDKIDGIDFLAWQRGFGASLTNAVRSVGNADHDGDVDANDLKYWAVQLQGNRSVVALGRSEPTSSADVAPVPDACRDGEPRSMGDTPVESSVSADAGDRPFVSSSSWSGDDRLASWQPAQVARERRARITRMQAGNADPNDLT
ncbi:MAG: hypothetical protein KDA99_05330, partial [Planctomycetales bacterium]|nr:hypothetical protein [Planctomycetales bacterium]